MIFELLVQNYYERNGSFDGIQASEIGETVDTVSMQYHTDPEELCYVALGARPQKFSIDVNGRALSFEVSGKNSFELHTAVAANNNRKCAKILNLKKVPKSLAHDLAAALHLPKKFAGALPETDALARGKEDRAVIDLLEAFYTKSNTAYIQYNGNLLTFNAFIRMLYSDKGLRAVASFSQIHKMGALIPVEVRPELRQPVIIQNVLYTHSNYNNGVMLGLQEVAVARATAPLSALNLPKKTLSVLPFLYYFEEYRQTYFNMLVLAGALDITYQELLNLFGYQVPDLIKSYHTTGAFIYNVGSRSYYSFYNSGSMSFSGLLGQIDNSELKRWLEAENLQPAVLLGADTITCLEKGSQQAPTIQ